MDILFLLQLGELNILTALLVHSITYICTWIFVSLDLCTIEDDYNMSVHLVSSYRLLSLYFIFTFIFINLLCSLDLF